MSRATDDEIIRRRSGWLIPLGIALIVLALGTVILLFYLAPSGSSLFEEQITPTPRAEIVPLRVHGHKFLIPANYLEYESARQGGDRHTIRLFALYPEMSGWSNWEAQSFTGNSPDSPIIHIFIRDESYTMSEAERLKRVYLSYLVDPNGSPGPYGLRRYEFQSDSGYQHQDLYVGQLPEGPVVMRCEELTDDNPSPSCQRDMEIAPGVALSYRFKQSKLAEWNEIGVAVKKLVASFEPARR